MAKKKKRPDKIVGVGPLIRKAALSGNYMIGPHAQNRSVKRQISLPEFDYILKKGVREPGKDEFKPQFDDWNYAVRGKTIDGRDIRVCVYFANKMIVVTLIAIGEDD
jgi:hypothetical protein